MSSGDLTHYAVVVAVVDEIKIAINRGSLHGIKIGQRFLIYAMSKDEIFDPITHESLGHLEVVKGTGVVEHVQDKMSTIKSDMWTRQSTKTVRRMGGLMSLYGGSHEIVEDEGNRERVPFDKPQVGDYAKPI